MRIPLSYSNAGIVAGLGFSACASVMKLMSRDEESRRRTDPWIQGAGLIVFALNMIRINALLRRDADHAGLVERLRKQGGEPYAIDEPIEAWRAWNVIDDGRSGVRLRSIAAARIWTPGAAMEGDVEAAPYREGVHAFKTKADVLDYALMNPFARRGWVYGTVSLWGSIVEYENGYRAQFGYPRTVYAEEGTAEALRRAYGCETRRVRKKIGWLGLPADPGVRRPAPARTAARSGSEAGRAATG